MVLYSCAGVSCVPMGGVRNATSYFELSVVLYLNLYLNIKNQEMKVDRPRQFLWQIYRTIFSHWSILQKKKKIAQSCSGVWWHGCQLNTEWGTEHPALDNGHEFNHIFMGRRQLYLLLLISRKWTARQFDALEFIILPLLREWSMSEQNITVLILPTVKIHLSKKQFPLRTTGL